MIKLKNKRVLVTGASSMIGRCIVESLLKREAEVDSVLHKECDLLSYRETVRRFENFQPDYCVHAAGYNGNISFNKNYPSDIFYNTTIMGLNTLRAAATVGVKKIVSTLASCAYKSTEDELKEEDFHEGLPDFSVEGHGLSKKAVFYYSRQIYRQYEIPAVCTIFNTAYGPHDSYDINKTKVVGALIKKFVDATENNSDRVVCWGTGRPRRELIFCEDAGEGVVQALEKYSVVDYPINIGYNKDISIRELSELIADLTGFKGEIFWDVDRPDGQYRKILNSTRMKTFGIDIASRTPLKEGIRKTIEWYKKNG